MTDLKFEFIEKDENSSADTQSAKQTLKARAEDNYNEIERIIKFRILKRIKNFEKDICEILGSGFEFAIAGNSLNKDVPNDYDLYALGEFEFNLGKIKEKVEDSYGKVLSETANALTVKLDDVVLQFCTYKYPTLKELVDTFDFAHIQIGAAFSTLLSDNGYYYHINLLDIYYNPNWEKAKLLETTFYTKPNVETSYPISSLLRSFKYKERGTFSGNSHIVSVFEILTQLLERGFNSYSDFKDQLAAVDLRLLEKKESDAAYKFYKICEARGLVKDTDDKEEKKEEEKEKEEEAPF